MRSLSASAMLALSACTCLAAGLGANDRRYVDDLRIDPASGQMSLLLVIDRPLEDGLTKPSVRRKLAGYRQWVDDPKFKSTFPTARPELSVQVILLHPAPRNQLGRSVLEQVEGHARDLKFVPKLRLAPPP